MLSTPANNPQEISRRLGLKRCEQPPFSLPSDISSCLFRRNEESLPHPEKRSREFNAGRWSAANVLGEMGVEGEVGVAADRSPIWPADAVGSISHSERFVWCLGGKQDSLISIGVDTEPVVDTSTLEYLKYEILNDEEEALGLAQGFDERQTFTAIFSAKESFYKCAYQLSPKFIGFHDVEVVSFDAQTITLQLTPDSPVQLPGMRRMQVEYVIQAEDVFTACWLRCKAKDQ